MPTVLLILGWRLFFYANEGNEPIHIHCRKGEKECKYWLDRENFDLEEAYAYRMSPRDRREIKKIIFEHYGCTNGKIYVDRMGRMDRAIYQFEIDSLDPFYARLRERYANRQPNPTGIVERLNEYAEEGARELYEVIE